LESFTGFSPIALLSGKQPAGTADPPSGILRETRYCKSVSYAACTGTQENTKYFQSFHWKKPYSQQQYSEQFFNKIILLFIQK